MKYTQVILTYLICFVLGFNLVIPIFTKEEDSVLADNIVVDSHYLITDISDYEDFGFYNVEKPYVYTREVLVEGHMPLVLQLSDDLSTSDTNILSSYFIGRSIDVTYNVLVNTTYEYYVPNYKEVCEDVINITSDKPEKICNDVLVGYDKCVGYKWIWKETNDLSSLVLSKGKYLVVDIVGRWSASVSKKSVDVVPVLFDDCYLTEYAWWNSSWSGRVKCSINDTYVASNLTNFPVLVNGTFDYLDRLEDIAFTNEDGDVQFSHEIELFDNATGRLVAWVNVTKVKHDEPTIFYMYYDNGVCADQQDVSGTWDSNYKLVLHMNEESGDPIESVGPGTVSYNGDLPSRSEFNGAVAGGQLFDGSDYANTTSALVSNGESLTVSVILIAHTKTQNTHYVFSQNALESSRISSSGAIQFMISGNIDTTYLSTIGRPFHIHYTTGDPSTTARMYINGTENRTGPLGTTYNSGSFYIGRRPDLVLRDWRGYMDEFRVSNIARSADWIQTEVRTIQYGYDGGFIDYSDPEGLTPDSEWQTVDSGYFTFNSEGRTHQTVDSGWFTFNSEGRTHNTIDSGYFTFETTERSWQTVESGWFSFDMASREWSTIESGYFTFNTEPRVWTTVDSGYFTFNTTDRSWQTISSGWFTFDTPDRSWKTISEGWFTFDMVEREFQTIDSGWFTFNTTPRIWYTEESGWFTFETTDRGWQLIESGWFAFETVERSFQTVESGWFIFDTISREWQNVSTGWFTFDTVERTWSTIESGWFIFDTEPRTWQTISSGWFTFRNTSMYYAPPNPANGTASTSYALSWEIELSSPGGLTFDWNISCNNGQFNNASSETNGTKTLSLTGLSAVATYTVWVNTTHRGETISRWYTFITPDVVIGFTYTIEGSTVRVRSTSTPTNDPIMEYNWEYDIEDGYTGETGYCDQDTYIISLPEGGILDLTLYIRYGGVILSLSEKIANIGDYRDINEPHEYYSKSSCEEDGYYWWDDECHDCERPYVWNVNETDVPDVVDDKEVFNPGLLVIFIVVAVFCYLVFGKKRRKKK